MSQKVVIEGCSKVVEIPKAVNEVGDKWKATEATKQARKKDFNEFSSEGPPHRGEHTCSPIQLSKL